MEPVKGFRDFSGKEAEKRAEIMRLIAGTFEKYGFETVETPIIESEEFVVGENKYDEAVRDVFRLQDRGKRKLALRYEFTFQLKRLAKNKKLPYKRYQIGYNFRDEPVREGRTRQFVQCDADIVGSTTKDEAETLAMASEILENLGIEFTILINNRKLLNEILDDLKIKKNREQVLRELDKIGKQTQQETQNALSKLGARNLLEAINRGERYFVKFDSYKEVVSLMDYCKTYGVKVKFAPSLVRGLSYYNGTVIEFWSKNLGVSICGGGSYLVNGIQSTGISLGLEPLMVLEKFKKEKEKTLVISLEQDKEAIKLANKLRVRGEIVGLYYGKPSRALDYANSYGFQKVVFVGKKEVKAKKFKVKDMRTGKESVLKI